MLTVTNQANSEKLSRVSAKVIRSYQAHFISITTNLLSLVHTSVQILLANCSVHSPISFRYYTKMRWNNHMGFILFSLQYRGWIWVFSRINSVTFTDSFIFSGQLASIRKGSSGQRLDSLSWQLLQQLNLDPSCNPSNLSHHCVPTAALLPSNMEAVMQAQNSAVNEQLIQCKQELIIPLHKCNNMPCQDL